MQEEKINKSERIFVPRFGAQETQVYRKDGVNRFFEIKNSMFNLETVCINFIVYDPNKDKGNRKSEEINAFINFENALLFCDKVLNGDFERTIIKYYIERLRPLVGQLSVLKRKASEANKTTEAATYEKLIKKSIAVVESRDIDELEKITAEISAVNGVNTNTGVKAPLLFHQMGGTSAEKLNHQGKSRNDGNGESRQLKLMVGTKKRFVLSAETGPGKKDDKGLIVPLYGNKPEHRIIIGMNNDELKGFALVLNAHIQAFLSAKYTKIALSVTEDNIAKLLENDTQTTDVIVQRTNDNPSNESTIEKDSSLNSEPTDEEIQRTLATVSEDDLPF